ncbi:pilus assembly protein Flp/PilA [Rhizobiales bacterium GAS188]|nr:pilus assembly protein Flp/PilA [Rhizobiales bacterium GAS188]
MNLSIRRSLDKGGGSVAPFLRDEAGATAIEYGLIAALISVVIIGMLGTVGTSLNSVFTSVNVSLTAN